MKLSSTSGFLFFAVVCIGCATTRPTVDTNFMKNDDFTGIIEADYYLPLSEGVDPSSKPSRPGVLYVNAPNYIGPSVVGGGEVVNKTLHEVMSGTACPVKGRVFISALIDATGEAKSPRITGSIDPDCDAGALEAFKRLQFIPAKVNGENVAMPLSLPVNVR